MWHRFDNNLRDALRRGLHQAGGAARSVAEPADLAAGMSEEQATAGAAGNALSADAIGVLERAYEHAANSTQRYIGVEHLKLALASPNVPPAAAPAASAAAAAPADDEPIENGRLSVGHPRFSGDPYPLYRELRKRPSVHRDP